MTQADKLTNLVYKACLDSSLWPELMLELTFYLNQVQRGSHIANDVSAVQVEQLSEHFQRAFEISDRMLSLQERETDFTAVLNAVAFGLALVDEKGEVLFQNRMMSEQLPQLSLDSRETKLIEANCDTSVDEFDQSGGGLSLVRWVETCTLTGTSKTLCLSPLFDDKLMLIPRVQAVSMGFPAKAAAVLLYVNISESDAFNQFAELYQLTLQEGRLVCALLRFGDLKLAAGEVGVSYESARTYIKRVYSKTGCTNQAGLVTAIAGSPPTMLRKRELTEADALNVRRLFRVSDGRIMEYFLLGPKSGYPVVHFDAMSGMSIDVTGYPQECLAHLERHNVKLIIPSRPGCFRSDMKRHESLLGVIPDIAELLKHLRISKFGVSAVSYGSATALAAAHEMGDRVERLVLSSVNYPAYKHPNWRDLDLFYHMSSVLANYWPSMFCQIVPFLVRSIMQNVDRYFERLISRSKSPHDISLLSHPTMRRRTVAMLAERTIAGMDGMVEENLLNTRQWSFDPRNIDTPVEIFHGALDNVAPIEGAVLLTEKLRNGSLHRLEGKGHYHHLNNWPVIVARAAGRSVEIGSDIYELASE